MTIHGAPWWFSPSHIEEGESAVRANDGWIVCTTSSDEHAQLISATPDMLAALNLVLSHWQSDYLPQGWEPIREIVLAARNKAYPMGEA